MTWEEVKTKIKDGRIQWKDFFDERQWKEIRFNRIYAADFAHGTADHNARLIIAKMAELLDTISDNVEFK